MEWWIVILVILGGLLIIMITGLPIAFGFMLMNICGALLFWGGQAGLTQLAYSFSTSVSSFIYIPLLLFILMGEVMFHSGIASPMINALDGLLGRIPGRLGLVAIAAGAVLSTLTSLSIGTVAILGSTLLPEMIGRGYKKEMALGPILGSGGLAPMIPPSSLAVLFGALAGVSIGKLLIAIIMPGILLATLYGTYIIIRCLIQPALAPLYDMPYVPPVERLANVVRYVLPVGLVIFLVTGILMLGIATPTEASATGALGTFVLVALYGRMKWDVVKKSVSSTLDISVMILMIIVGATAFSEILSFSGASRGVVNFALSLPLGPIGMIIVMNIVVLIMGCFIDVMAIMMITLPLFMPVVNALGFDPIWFGVLMLINLELASKTPPYGLSLFVMKGVAPADTTMLDVYRAVFPFILIDLTAMAVVMAFPIISLWLPSLML